MLVEEGTTIVKFFLLIDRDEQRRRFQERFDDPTKRWKFKMGDLAERALWDNYVAAFEEALSRCSTEAAPWYVIPANRNWFRNLAVAEILGDVLEDLKPAYPPIDPTCRRISSSTSPPVSVARATPLGRRPGPGPSWSAAGSRRAPPAPGAPAGRRRCPPRTTYSQATCRLGRDSSVLRLRSLVGQHPQDGEERARLIADGEGQRRARGPAGSASGRRQARQDGLVRPADDDEPGPVGRVVLDPVGQDRQAEMGGRPRRQDGRRAGFGPRSAISRPAPAVL